MSRNNISYSPILASIHLGNELSEEHLSMAMKIAELYKCDLDIAVLLINPNIQRKVVDIMTNHRVEILIALQLLDKSDEEIADILRNFITAEAINIVPDEESNPSAGNAVGGGSSSNVSHSNQEDLIHDLNQLGYTISSTDAQAFVSSNPTLDRTTMCAMYILLIIESRPNNDDHASAGHASAWSCCI